MGIEHLLAQKLGQTVVDGRLDIELVEELENLETIDEAREFESSAAHAVTGIQMESIISKLDDDNQGLELNRYDVKGLGESINQDEFVLIVEDTNLNRVVEAHVLNQELATESNSELIHEALVLSELEHPGIPPIYDLNVSQNNLVYCTLKKIEGTPLSEICQRGDANPKMGVHALDTVSEIVSNFIKISEILQFAHKKKIIHRNIKPENMLVGDFGEVYLIAWGNSFNCNQDEPDFQTLRGTPLYMSPEQANCSHVDERSDIYSLGASLFHVLLKRPPVLKGSLNDFWAAKKSGVIEAYDPAKDGYVDQPLLAICMRCLQAKPADRYQSLEEVIDDLRHYQNGQMVEVYKYGVLELSGYWLRQNKMHLRWAAAIIALIMVLGLVYWQIREQEQSGWGEAIYEEQFNAGEEWRDHWVLRRDAGEFVVKDGKLQTKGGPEFLWYYNKKLHGGVAIEFEGEMLPGSTPGDLSIVYCEDLGELESGGRAKQEFYLQHGAVGNACSMIEGPNGRLDYVEKSLEHGVRYHVRGEINGKELKLYLNGELTCTYDLLFPLNSGYIGLYAYYENKTFDNVKIYNRELPKVTNIIKTGDLLMENELYDLAIERYEQISEQYKGTEIGEEGEYKRGLCFYKKGEIARAFEIWDAMEKTSFAMQINFYRWEQLAISQNYSELLKQMYALYRSADKQVRTQIREQWGRFLYKVRVTANERLVREFLRFRNVNFPQDQIFSRETFYVYRLLGEPEKVLELYPNQPNVVTLALGEMGEYQRILDEYPQQRSAVVGALQRLGEYQRIIDEFSDLRNSRVSAMLALGMFEQLAIDYPDSQKVRKQILVQQGAYDQLLEEFNDENTYLDVLYYRGEAEKFLELMGDQRSALRGYDCQMAILMDQYLSGDEEALAQMHELNANLNYWQKTVLSQQFSIHLLPDVLLGLAGNTGPIKDVMDRIYQEKHQMYGMRHWHNVGLMSGALSLEEYMQQPMQHQIKADALFYQALHEDLFGDKGRALVLYQQHVDMPKHQKSTPLPVKRFIAHRVSVLSR